MSSGGTFVSVPATAMLEATDHVVARLRRAGHTAVYGRVGSEVVLDVRLTGRPVAGGFRVYTSLPSDDHACRGRGEDACRVVAGYWRDSGFRPLGKARRVFRTAPRKLPHGQRVAHFLDRLVSAMREAYELVRRLEPCPHCGAPMVQREGRYGAFLGCSEYRSCPGRKSAPCG